METLNLPTYSFSVKSEAGRTYIFDSIRKKYVVLTPEEWVRQHLVNFLITEKKVPAGLIVLEKKIIMNTMKRRPDILLYDNKGKPVMIVECKAPEVTISQDTFDQIARYNSVIRAPYLVVTNGLKHYCCLMDHQHNSYQFLEEIPDYSKLTE